MNANAFAPGASRTATEMAVNVALWALLAVAVGLLVVFAAMAAVAIGVVVLGAALAQHLAPQPRPATVSRDLQARRTPDGWVVEVGAARRS